jgi:hypothetical protein
LATVRERSSMSSANHSIPSRNCPSIAGKGLRLRRTRRASHGMKNPGRQRIRSEKTPPNPAPVGTINPRRQAKLARPLIQRHWRPVSLAPRLRPPEI